MQYEDIPFGVTNGRTHHNISYFPASTIGSVVVDRGLGQCRKHGRRVHVRRHGQIVFPDRYRRPPYLAASATYGSFNTISQATLNIETGNLDLKLRAAKALINLQALSSDGALTLQNLSSENALVKVESEIAPNWNLTVFGETTATSENIDGRQ